jgi:hypothetical protein
MMNGRGSWVALVSVAVLCQTARAQLAVPAGAGAAAPGLAGPAVGATGATGATGTTAVAGAAQPNNIWSKICPTPEQCAACQQKFCNTQIGQLTSSFTKPLGLFTGGIPRSPCPDPNQPNPADLQQPADSALGAAARIKQEEAQAKARRAAVRYLGTVDCHRFPEAQAALINALRADQNECVRWEAAMALGNGCCCGKKVIEALTLTVSGSRRDGNPIECSPRVRACAAKALDHCLAVYCEPAVEAEMQVRPEAPPPVRPEVPAGPAPRPEVLPAPPPPGGILPPPRPVGAALVPHPRNPENDLAILNARQALESWSRSIGEAGGPAALQPPPLGVGREPQMAAKDGMPSDPEKEAVVSPRLPPRGKRDLFHVLMKAVRPDSVQ